VPNSSGASTTSWIVAGLNWAREQSSNGVRVVNLSAGAIEDSLSDDELFALSDACMNVLLSQQLLVTSAGNQPTDRYGVDVLAPVVPAALYERSIAVGAILPDASRWRDWDLNSTECVNNPFLQCLCSNYGPGRWLDVEAPGGRFIVTAHGGALGDYYTLDNCTITDFSTMGFGGTSAAAPIVSGASALLHGMRSDLWMEDIEQVLKMTAMNLHQPPYSIEHGYGG
jgi:subtilisin family serine protease